MNDEKKEEVYYALEEKEINAVLQYLAMKPFAEVNKLIELLRDAKPVKINKDKGE